MSRLALAICLAFIAGCASAPPPPTEEIPLTQTCAEVVRQLERGSSLDSAQKRELIESFKGQTFNWQLRVLAMSDETSRSELAGGMAFDVECIDRQSTTEETGLRYLFTLYFQRRIPELAKLSKGSLLTVSGSLTRYEGEEAFAALAKTYNIDKY